MCHDFQFATSSIFPNKYGGVFPSCILILQYFKEDRKLHKNLRDRAIRIIDRVFCNAIKRAIKSDALQNNRQ